MKEKSLRDQIQEALEKARLPKTFNPEIPVLAVKIYREKLAEVKN